MRRSGFIFFIIIICTLLAGCNPVVGNGQAYYDNEPLLLTKDNSLGQTFTANYDGLQGIDLYLFPQEGGSGRIELNVIAQDDNTDIGGISSLPISEIIAPGWHRFIIPSIPDSNLVNYRVLLTIAGEGSVGIGSSSGSSFLDGSAYQNEQPMDDAQLAFIPIYRMRWLIFDLLKQGLEWIVWLLFSIILFVIPGWVLLTTIWRGLTGLDLIGKIGIGAGVSLAVYPLLMLWAFYIGVKLGSIFAWGPVLISCAILIWKNHKSFRFSELRRFFSYTNLRSIHAPDFVLCMIILFLIFSRLWPIRNLPCPLGPDPIQHLTIAQLMINNGGLFTSWLPYFPYQTFTVHFGFHSDVAVFSWLTSIDILHSTLIVGQVINILAILALYPLVLLLTNKNKWAGIGTIIVAGFLSPLPTYYLNWGRYPQLAGQVILPIAIWMVIKLVMSNKVEKNQAVLGGFVLSGLALTYYRQPIILIVLIVIWLAVLVINKEIQKRWKSFLTNISIFVAATLIFLLPKILDFAGTIMLMVLNTGITKGTTISKVVSDLEEWNQYNFYFPDSLIVLFVISFMYFLIKKNWHILTFGLWIIGLSLLSASALLHIPFATFMKTRDVIIAYYIPIAVLCGCFLGEISNWLIIIGKKYAIGLLIVVILCVGSIGAIKQSNLVEIDVHGFVTFADLRAMNWIKENIPQEAVFLVETKKFRQNTIFGGDAGWYLPYFTQRANTMPPQYALGLELPNKSGYSQDLINFIFNLNDITLSDQSSIPLLCDQKVSYVYIGQVLRGGTPADTPSYYDASELFKNPAFDLIYHKDRVYIFRMDQQYCSMTSNLSISGDN